MRCRRIRLLTRGCSAVNEVGGLKIMSPPPAAGSSSPHTWDFSEFGLLQVLNGLKGWEGERRQKGSRSVISQHALVPSAAWSAPLSHSDSLKITHDKCLELKGRYSGKHRKRSESSCPAAPRRAPAGPLRNIWAMLAYLQLCFYVSPIIFPKAIRAPHQTSRKTQMSGILSELAELAPPQGKKQLQIPNLSRLFKPTCLCKIQVLFACRRKTSLSNCCVHWKWIKKSPFCCFHLERSSSFFFCSFNLILQKKK